ncbi:hypothetical protein G7047_13385 [Diaphorobacter sp. HDW4A]|uniref:hypothetical protein n=1 Tax=Diaphorobacter sp. HDW4A TaxID=2714924 RepID=UPI00140DAD20|nr:hypothetical protein [Diaphorobacter sp. HDW4A]QIL80787.1 hypothetical protein G7047_13385 [Diaphorobacter sp. HDW4A]
MKTKTQFAACAAALLLLQGCSAQSNVEVSVKSGPLSHMMTFEVRAIADEAIVKSVTINRGNCALGPITENGLKKTIKLKFGESFSGFGICTLPSLKEMKVGTDSGAFVFSFN